MGSRVLLQTWLHVNKCGQFCCRLKDPNSDSLNTVCVCRDMSASDVSGTIPTELGQLTKIMRM